MNLSEITEKSPMRVLEKSINMGMGPGSLGVIMARAGVGKTACLVHIAIDRILLGKQVAHVSIDESSDRVRAWYQETAKNLARYYGVKEVDGKQDAPGIAGTLQSLVKSNIEGNSVILNYTKNTFSILRLKESLKTLEEQLKFKPSMLVIDDVDFEAVDRAFFEEAKKLAEDAGLEIWFSARSFQKPMKVNQRGIPYPCDEIDDLFDVIVMLKPEPPIITLQVLKGNGHSEEGIHLDPKTMLLKK